MTSGLMLFNRAFAALLVKALCNCFAAFTAVEAIPAAGGRPFLYAAGALYMPVFCEAPVFVKISRLMLWAAALFTEETAVLDLVFDVFAADDFAVLLELAEPDF